MLRRSLTTVGTAILLASMAACSNNDSAGAVDDQRPPSASGSEKGTNGPSITPTECAAIDVAQLAPTGSPKVVGDDSNGPLSLDTASSCRVLVDPNKLGRESFAYEMGDALTVRTLPIDKAPVDGFTADRPKWTSCPLSTLPAEQLELDGWTYSVACPAPVLDDNGTETGEVTWTAVSAVLYTTTSAGEPTSLTCEVIRGANETSLADRIADVENTCASFLP